VCCPRISTQNPPNNFFKFNIFLTVVGTAEALHDFPAPCQAEDDQKASSQTAPPHSDPKTHLLKKQIRPRPHTYSPCNVAAASPGSKPSPPFSPTSHKDCRPASQTPQADLTFSSSAKTPLSPPHATSTGVFTGACSATSPPI
jgi:hypothetical protein